MECPTPLLPTLSNLGHSAWEHTTTTLDGRFTSALNNLCSFRLSLCSYCHYIPSTSHNPCACWKELRGSLPVRMSVVIYLAAFTRTVSLSVKWVKKQHNEPWSGYNAFTVGLLTRLQGLHFYPPLEGFVGATPMTLRLVVIIIIIIKKNPKPTICKSFWASKIDIEFFLKPVLHHIYVGLIVSPLGVCFHSIVHCISSWRNKLKIQWQTKCWRNNYYPVGKLTTTPICHWWWWWAHFL